MDFVRRVKISVRLYQVFSCVKTNLSKMTESFQIFPTFKKLMEYGLYSVNMTILMTSVKNCSAYIEIGII